MKKTRVAVLGAGNWGRNHVRALAALPEADLVAVCDTDAERREAVKRQYPAVLTTEHLGEALDQADAVVVATPAAFHGDHARQAIERDMPVLVEKPFALTVRDAESIAELADKLGAKVLLATAKQRKLSDTQRLGYLLAVLDQERLAAPLAKWLSRRRTTIVKLRADRSKEGYFVDERFRVIPNEEIEPDL